MEKYIVDNAIIMAAGLSSRFAPLSHEKPKALLTVKGEVLIERQIKQLQDAGIKDITIVVGYKSELFYYLEEKFRVTVTKNIDYDKRNNSSSLYAVRDKLKNTYICSADNYFTENVFETSVNQSYYSSVFEKGETDEWCIKTDENGLILAADIGGFDCWVMLGHVFFSNEFSKTFVKILEEIYKEPETYSMLWEDIYLKYIDKLDMYIKKYDRHIIFEFDTLDELREFDKSYVKDTRSKIIKNIAKRLNCSEEDIRDIKPVSENLSTIGFEFTACNKRYSYNYEREEFLEK